MSNARRPSTDWTAMVLAAGFGKRMLPITLERPKPLVEIGGRALIDHALDRLVESGFSKVVVNVHHLPDQLEAHLKRRNGLAISVSDERGALLETGGGVKKALPQLGPRFLVMNSDTLWIEGPQRNLDRLIAAFDAQRMDVLLMVAATASSLGYDGPGDFAMDAAGRLTRRGERNVAPFVYAGVGLFTAGLFADTPEGAFSLNLIFDRAAQRDRLFGMRLDGEWLHVGTPASVTAAEDRLLASVS
jgi:MurNAc alpha-1-phosphate uridylyltransferase